MDLCVRGSDGLDTLTEDAGTIGDALSKVSQAYRAVDELPLTRWPNDSGVGSRAEPWPPEVSRQSLSSGGG